MDYLLEHIKIDLQESLGEIPFVIQYINCFRQALPQKYTPGKVYEIHEDAFDRIENRFFDKITISVQVEREDDFTAPEYGANGEYYPDSHITPDGKLSHPEIELRLKTGMGYMIKNYLSRTFAHELTHAYEDYQRLLHGKKGLKQHAEDRNYDNVADAIKNYKSRYQKLIAYTVYLLMDCEKNANIGRVRQDLQGKPLKTYKEIMSAIKSTQVYQAYNIISDFLGELDRVYNDQDWEDFIKDDIEHLTGYRFKNVHQAQKWLARSWRRFQKTFENRVGKIIADMRDRQDQGLDRGYEENSDMFRPGSDFWEDLESEEDMPDWMFN